MPERSPAQQTWANSARWRAIGRAAIRAWHAKRASLSCCGAKAKSTGQPCRNLPLPGRTRCKFHGGATPRGDGPLGWHTPAFPGGIPTGKPRSDAYKRRRKRDQVACREAMTPDERARHEAWQVAHEPGSAAKRQRRRKARAAGALIQRLLQPDERPKATPARREPTAGADGAPELRGGVFD
ncbi:HGGxSTG domain-containing protein [Methylobacterium trifolii]